MTLAAAALVPAAGHNPDLGGVDPDLLKAYERIQQRFGRDLPITSGYRSPERNARAGGAKKSQHMHGKALDISVRNMPRADRNRLIQIASEEGVTGIGVYGNGLHFDTGPRRAWGPSHKSQSVPGWARGVIDKHLSGGFRVAQADTANDASPKVTFDDLRRMVAEADAKLPPARQDSGGTAQRPSPGDSGGITFDQLHEMAKEADARRAGQQVESVTTHRQIDPPAQQAHFGLGQRVESGIDALAHDVRKAGQPGIVEQFENAVHRSIFGSAELDAPEIEGELTRRDPMSNPVVQILRNALPAIEDALPEPDRRMDWLRQDLLMAETEEDMVPILRNAFPDAPIQQDKNGNHFIQLDGEWFSLDKSGLSWRDAQEILKEAPMLMGAASPGARAGMRVIGGGLGRAVGAGAGTAAGDAGVQGMNIAAGSNAEFDTFRTALSGAFGVAGELIAIYLGRMMGDVISNARRYRNGQITSEGREVIERNGVDPDLISDSFAPARGPFLHRD